MPFLATIKPGDEVLLRASVIDVGEIDVTVLVDVSLRLTHAGAGTRLRVPLAALIPAAGMRRADILNASLTHPVINR